MLEADKFEIPSRAQNSLPQLSLPKDLMNLIKQPIPLKIFEKGLLKRRADQIRDD